ncbi:hypothetical protein JTB14_015053 [Gonioctena quinquepunctata]|nr:hypothetical protein JTB14_015053 [Gonioctena quinquepunctata]
MFHRNSWLVGDSGYPEQCWLMTPIVDAVAGTPEFADTEAQMSARNFVERCISVLKGRFRCVMGERKLRYEPGKVGTILNACAILHNICTEGRLEFEPVNSAPVGDEGNVIVNPQPNIDGIQDRREIIERYFQ